MVITWDEAEVTAPNRSQWRRSVAQCIHLEAARGLNQGQGHRFVGAYPLAACHAWQARILANV